MFNTSSRRSDSTTATATTASRAHASPLAVLALAVVGLSTAAPLVRLSKSSPVVIATWRLGFSLIVVSMALLVTGTWREWARLKLRDVLLASAGGVLLALHFWSWNTSLRYTSVAASVSLVNLQPALIAIISSKWLGERPVRRQWIGIVLAISGALVVGLADMPGGVTDFAASLAGGAGSRALFGDLLAIAGAVTATCYYLIGRRLRQIVGVWPYVGLVYSAAFLSLLALCAVTGAALVPQSPRELSIFASLAVGPMLLGHTGMNWALGHLPAFVVNLTVLGEPLGATILAALIPGIGDVPGAGVLIGGAILLLGVYLAAPKTS